MTTVVVVDDEPIVRKDLCLMLESAGYHVAAQAADGLDAINVCREFRPTAVIMDMKMPLLDGASAAEIIMKEGLCHCILALTAYSDKESVVKAKLAGVVYFLVKPIRANTLIPALEIALETSRKMQDMRHAIAQLEERQAEQVYIEQAKGILAKADGISEQEAYAKMRRLSMERRMRIVDLARYVVDSGSDKKTIRAAKSMLMLSRGLSETEAYQVLKQYSIQKSVSMLEAAQHFVSGG